jgi:hypothetical protein
VLHVCSTLTVACPHHRHFAVCWWATKWTNGRGQSDVSRSVRVVQRPCDIFSMSNQLILSIRGGVNDGNHGNQRK